MLHLCKRITYTIYRSDFIVYKKRLKEQYAPELIAALQQISIAAAETYFEVSQKFEMFIGNFDDFALAYLKYSVNITQVMLTILSNDMDPCAAVSAQSKGKSK